jgi:hypothetical protein
VPRLDVELLNPEWVGLMGEANTGVTVLIAVPRNALHERLVRGAALLSLIDTRRAKTGLAGLGSNIEREIVGRELRDLELQIRTSDYLDTTAIR